MGKQVIYGQGDILPDINLLHGFSFIKIQKLAELKSVYKQILYKNHDMEDKIEALAGLKTAQEITEIKNWIKAVKYVFGQVKTQINNVVDVADIDISYNTILGQVETYYLTL